MVDGEQGGPLEGPSGMGRPVRTAVREKVRLRLWNCRTAAEKLAVLREEAAALQAPWAKACLRHTNAKAFPG